MPPEQARRLEREFPEGSGVYVWGASERHRAVLGLPAGTYVVDVSNAVVRQVFELVFAYRTPDTRIQHFLDWDDHQPFEARRPYPIVYFLRDPVPTVRTQATWFRDAFKIDYANWLPGQKLFSDSEISRAMAHTNSASVADFLGIPHPADGSVRVGHFNFRERGEAYDSTGGTRAGQPNPTLPNTDSASETTSSNTGTGQGRGLTAPERRAVEMWAMSLAAANYALMWDEVRDVSTRESYDLLCRSKGRELRVEVKGTTGGADSVVLTRNEVAHAQEHHPNVALFVVHGITLTGRGTVAPVASGGHVRRFEPWDLDDGFRLIPETYRCVLPQPD